MTWLEPYFAEILFHRISECALDCYLQHFYGHHFARSVDRRSNLAGRAEAGVEFAIVTESENEDAASSDDEVPTSMTRVLRRASAYSIRGGAS